MNPVGITINIGGVPTDADTGTDVTVSIYAVPYPATTAQINEDLPNPLWTGVATWAQTGTYEIVPNAVGGALVPGYYRFDWNFTLGGKPYTTYSYIQVGPPSPCYDALAPPFVNAVENVWLKFADVYDSGFGGPYLTVWYNQHFGRGRVAQLMEQSVWHLNNMAQPASNYSITGIAPMGGGAPLFPLNSWAGLLNTAATVEVLKHLMRSYVEEPIVVGNVSVRLDRRDYMQRWGSMLADEQALLQSQLSVFKVQSMFNGTPRALIQGGAFGSYGVPRYIGSIPARPLYMNRWF
jgi:hypothetical protein